MYFTTRSAMFTQAKVAQMSAFFLEKGDGKLGHLKLIKLLYLSDKKSVVDTGYPMTDDEMMSLPNGPILSDSLDLINGNTGHIASWSEWISPAHNNEVTLSKQFDSYEDLDELSLTEIDILEQIHKDFGWMTAGQLIRYTHSEACPEWTDPMGSRLPINYSDILEANGMDADEASEQQREIESQKSLNRLLA